MIYKSQDALASDIGEQKRRMPEPLRDTSTNREEAILSVRSPSKDRFPEKLSDVISLMDWNQPF
jgi:hypothetical protein